MTKEEALEHFERTYVQGKVWEKVFQAEEYFYQHQDALVEGLFRSFRSISEKIRGLQAKGEISRVGYIQYSMLRSAILENRPTHRIDVHNDKWYFDLGQKECQDEYDGCEIFRFLHELSAELERPRKRYFGVVSPADLERIKLREATKFNQFIIYLTGKALKQAEFNGRVPEFAKAEEFEVRVGEYYDLSEVVYKEDVREKDAEDIKEWLEDKHEDQYVAAVFKNLDLSDGNYLGIDLRRTDFRGSNLSGSNLQNCLLINSCLRGCMLERTDFSHAMIHDADFQNANLRRSVFKGAEGAPGVKQAMASGIYSFTGVNFVGSDLKTADFRNANLLGANFRDAKLDDTDFRGAKLKGAVFDKTDIDRLDLTEEQRKNICWVGERVVRSQ